MAYNNYTMMKMNMWSKIILGLICIKNVQNPIIYKYNTINRILIFIVFMEYYYLYYTILHIEYAIYSALY